jgi:UDP-N-acetyl-D-mannosaminuronic acid dehydrogenase
MPGRLLANLAACSRVVGGWTPAAGEAAATLYRILVGGDIDVTDCLTADLVKTTENAYRDVQIAFANEVALLCENHGANVYAVRDLVNKSPRRDMHVPGAGVGGHCIPKDPWLLISGPCGSTARLIPSARGINDSMPAHVGELAQAALARVGRPLAEARILVLGYAYLEDSDDARNSPTQDLLEWLRARDAYVDVHDPCVPGLDIDLTQASVGADCIILMVAHSAYRHLSLDALGRAMRTRILVDGRHFFDPEVAASAGFAYRCVGIGD